MKNVKPTFILSSIALILLAFAGGWFLKGGTSSENSCQPSPLRIGGFKFVRPLLICNTSSNSPTTPSFTKTLQNAVNKEKNAGRVETASVYFQDFKTDERVSINQDEKFHSASTGKVPIMIAFYKMAESNPGFLSQGIKYVSGIDANAGQEIKPEDYAKIGNIYTVEELIEKMIKYSDNNSTLLLLSLINPKQPDDTKIPAIRSIYDNLQIPFPTEFKEPENFDFLTAEDLSYFFRILYNATYLGDDFSEKALQLLSETDYKNGLVAGVPEGTVISHKFGIENVVKEGAVTGRELHDCGIVYHPKNPYLLCVMTKSSANLPDIESAIKGISAATYQYENSRN